MSENTRPISADDLVGILIHRSNQLASNLSVHGVNANWNGITQHLISMYQDLERVKSLVEPQNGGELADDPAQPN